MAKQVTPLTDPKIDAAKNKDKPYKLYDGGGLIIDVRPLPSRKKIWRFKYSHAITAKDVLITLGEYPALTLKMARAKRAEFETMLANSLDPRDEIQVIEAKKDNATSLEKITRQWHTEQTRKNKWTGDTGEKTLRKFENHLFPLIGSIPIEEIETRHLTAAVTNIDEKGINYTARNLKANLVRVFSYAIQHGYVKYNPARELEGLLITQKKKHHPALPHEQLNVFFQKVNSYKGSPLTRLCVLLTLHVFIRSSEVRFARWSEIDFDKKQWIIPAHREAVDGVRYSDRGAKMKEAHLVPLSPQVIEILRQLQAYSGHCENVFPSRNDPKKFISENTVNKALRNMGYDTTADVCGHGFRTMACGALIQSTLYSEDAVERQMSHKERNEVRGSYTHMAEFLEERKSMMCWWSNYLDLNQNSFISPYDYGQQIKQARDDQSIIQFKRA